MSTVSQTRDPVQEALNSRPYLHRRYYPIASFLIEHEYSDASRNRIIDWLADGGLLESLVADHTLWPEDLAPAQQALDDGRAWERRYRLRLSVPDPDPDSDEEWNDPTARPDGSPAGDDNDRTEPGTAADDDETVEWVQDPRDLVTADVEPFHPGFDPDRIKAMREWHDRNDFRSWLESQGGERV